MFRWSLDETTSMTVAARIRTTRLARAAVPRRCRSADQSRSTYTYPTTAPWCTTGTFADRVNRSGGPGRDGGHEKPTRVYCAIRDPAVLYTHPRWTCVRPRRVSNV